MTRPSLSTRKIDPTRDVRPGQVWRYLSTTVRGGEIREDPTSDIRIVRAGKRMGDWVGVLVDPDEEWRRDHEWTIVRAQFEDGRYKLLRAGDRS